MIHRQGGVSIMSTPVAFQFRLLSLSGAAVALFLASAPQAAMASLKNATLQWNYYCYGGLYQAGNNFTANGQVGGNFDGYFNISADKNSVTFDYSTSSGGTWSSSQLSLAPTIYNGIAINLISAGTITKVKIDKATNMVGFNKSRISFTANQIQVDWQNLPFTPSTIVKLDVKATQGAQFHIGSIRPVYLPHAAPANAPRPAGSTPP
jgi:hypothetical protein